ncbi:MAG TPA: hypothetical protein VKB96_11020 [Gammaproteobacteria bacterium]|nr:hypothetical protein [Gammaproteobacteria bacterium]
MTDYAWPEGLCPDRVSFSLETQTGRNVSPLTRQQKTYELTAPLWRCTIMFTGNYRGVRGRNDPYGQQNIGGRVDALLAKLRGGANRLSIYDFDRPLIRGTNDGWSLTNTAVAAGAETATISGFMPNTPAFLAGDYVGGDGRPHLVLDDVTANSSGVATISVYPPFIASIASGAMLYGKAPGWFRLTGDEYGQVMPDLGGDVTYQLEFLEDPYSGA